MSRQPSPDVARGGFLNVLKPPGMSSHDVVQYVRRVLGLRSVGHTGTLDPAAAGVLVLTVGPATRLGEYLLEGDKAYRAEVTLGLTTDTDDAEGQLLSQQSAAAVTAEAVAAALAPLRGTITMRPPAHSAVRVDGKRLYERARAGEAVQAPERTVRVEELCLLDFQEGEQARALLDVTCSKGTYIRSLARMLGEALGCGGCLTALLRTRVNVHTLQQAVTLEQLAQAPEACLLSAAEALPHLPAVTLPARETAALGRGQAVPLCEAVPAGPVLVYNAEGHLVCLAEAGGDSRPSLQPRKVFLTTG